MKTEPIVTVGLPVFNGERYLAEAIESILAQSYGDFELILSDNASTDGTAEICARYAAGDQRVRVVRHDTNVGAAANFNGLFRAARGAYFKWAAHDDVLHADYLARTLAVLEMTPDAVAVHSRVGFIGAAGECLGDDPFPLRRVGSPRASERFEDVVLTSHWSFWAFALMRTSLLARTGLIGSYTSSDRVLLAHLALLGRFIEFPEVLFFSRDHGERALKKIPNRLRLPRWLRAVGPLPAAEWYDPAHAGRIFFPQWNLWRRYHDVVRNADLPAAERARCRLVLLRWLLRNRNAAKLFRDVILAVEQRLQSGAGTAPLAARPGEKRSAS